MKVSEIVTELANPKYADLIESGNNNGLVVALNANLGNEWPAVAQADDLKAIVALQLEKLTVTQNRVFNTLMANGTVPIGAPDVRLTLAGLFPRSSFDSLQVPPNVTLSQVREAVKQIPTSAWRKSVDG